MHCYSCPSTATEGTEQFDTPFPVSDFVYVTSEWRYFIPSQNWRQSFSVFFTDLSYICDFMPVYSLGKGLGLGPTGPSNLPAAISTERRKISNQFMQTNFSPDYVADQWMSQWPAKGVTHCKRSGREWFWVTQTVKQTHTVTMCSVSPEPAEQ